jgi:glycosyltransferase involved in cell wall biosynthesis
MIMPKEPLVSIIMNCYNGEKYLREALNSVIEQTFQNWELIFWDNQSSDRSAFVFKSYDEKRFKYYYSPKHTLLYKARNYAIEKASGEFYAFLDVDDWWDTKKLENQIPLFNDLEVGLVYGNYWYENEQNRSRKILYKHILPSGKILNDLLKNYVVGLLTVVIRRNSFESLHKPFNSKYHVIGDFDCVIRIATDWKVVCYQKPVGHYRWTGENESNNNREKQIKELEHWYSEMKQHSVISTDKNFSIGIKNKIIYMKTKLQIENKNYFNTFLLINKLPMGIMKLKLLAIVILPNKILNYFLNTSLY